MERERMPGRQTPPPSRRAGSALADHPALRLQRSMGNRAVGQLLARKGKPGFGNTAETRSLKVEIVGHASPRWKGAKTADEADRLNDDLSRRRSEAVRDAMEKLIKAKMGDDVLIDFGPVPASQNRQGIPVDRSHKGSQEARDKSGADRARDDEYFRRVNVDVEFKGTKWITEERTVPGKTHYGWSRDWKVTIKKVGVHGIVIPGPAWGGIEIVIKNPKTNKERTYVAILKGGGDPMFGDTPDKDVGRKEVTFHTDRELGFDDFEGEPIRVSRMDLQLLFGAARWYLSIPNLGTDKIYMGQEWGLGFPGGFVTYGTLRGKGTNPGDTYKDPDRVEKQTREVKEGASEGLILTFPTGSADLAKTELDRLESFVEINARRLGRFAPRRP
jgi:hypothetical protein